MRDTIEYFFFSLIHRIARRLSFRGAERVGALLGTAVYSITNFRKRVTLDNLVKAFPEKTPSEIHAIARGAYRNYGIALLEFLWASDKPPEVLKPLVRFVNPEVMHRALQRKKGVLLLSGHYGAWEFLIPIPSLEFGVQAAALVQHQRNAKIDAVIDAIRRRFGNSTIPMGVSSRRVLTALAENKIIPLLADQSGPKEAVFVEFFGRPAATHRGVAAFSLKTGAPIVMGFFVRQPDGGNIHLALLQRLRARQLRLVVGSPLEPQPLVLQPDQDLLGLGIAHLLHRRVKRGLAEPLLEHSGGMQQLIRNDGVEHAHAALVKHAEDRLLGFQPASDLPAQGLVGLGQLHQRERFHVALIVADPALAKPLPQAGAEEPVREILAPKTAVGDASLGHRTVQVQHPDQSWPGAAPVGHRQDRAAVRVEAGQDMMAVLPDGFGHDQRRGGIQAPKHFHPHLLGVYEPVLFLGIVRMRANRGPSLRPNRPRQQRFHPRLLGPAFLVGRQPQVAARDQIKLLRFE